VTLPPWTKRQVSIGEQFISASVRPFADKKEAWQLLATGQFAPEGRLEWAGTSIISCQTSQWVVAFAVKRPDVPLMLHFIDNQVEKQHPSLGDDASD
jgi:hypothetical protein